MTDHSEAKIYWPDGEPSGDIIARVREDIAKYLGGRDEPSQLMFHTVFLGESMSEGPTIILTGNPENNGFTAQYGEPMRFSIDEFPDVDDAIEAAIAKFKGEKDE